ncbi:MAG: thiamine-phosphate kinase [Candidatus Aureabacteria bacterium]|nr:thiamine-phosphate kinase [Candidatus Auribacterota bacterium]
MTERETLRGVGEFGLIEELKKIANTGVRTLVGIGDDAAVIESPREDRLLLFTTDMLVEGTHFDLARATPYQVGWKAIGCSLSDIAAMGGTPVAAVVSLGAPAGCAVAFCRELYRGINDLARRFGCDIAGGDTVGTPGGLILSVAMLGEVERAHLVRRSGARPGDGAWVTGSLGGALAGTHLSFIPRIEEARFLVAHAPVTAMMDLSDGLGSDLYRMAGASGVGFRIEAGMIPIDRAAVGRVGPRDALRHALYDGEDFELLFTASPSCDERSLAAEFSKSFTCGITRIGTVIERGGGIVLAGDGGETPLDEGGFSHYGTR